MRKLTVLTMVLVLCLQVFSGTFAYGAEEEQGNNIWIDSYRAPSSIYEGDSFEFNITIRNRALYRLDSLYVDIDQSSDFYADPTYKNYFSGSIEANETKRFDSDYKLVYKGTGNSLTLVFRYKVYGANSTPKEYTETHTLYIRGVIPSGGATQKPRLALEDTGRMPVIAAGTAYQLKYKLVNISDSQVKNVKLSLKMTDMAKAPLVLENYNIRKTISNIEARGSAEAVFDLYVYKTAPEGVYELELQYDHDNTSAKETVYIKVENNNTNPRIVVDGISLKPSESTADAVILELTLKNLGSIRAENVKVTLGGLKSDGFTVYNSSDVRYLNMIGENGTAKVSYELMPPASGKAGSNELSVKFDYTDTAGNKYSDQSQIFVPAGEGENSKPNISFEQIVSPQNAVTPGQEFTIGFDLKNNGGAQARNIKVTLSADGAIISRSMNPIYLADLAANTAENISFTLFAADDAATKNYPVALNIEYEDVFGTKYNASQYIGVYIDNETGKTVPRIIIDNYSMDPFPVNAGEDFKLRMSFLNTSKTVDVSNIKVTVTSDDGTFTPTDSGNTFYIESIPKTTNIERELMLHVKPDAEQKSYMLTVTFEYEDGKGNPYTAKETMSVRVLQSPRLVLGDLNMMTETFTGQPVYVYLDFYNMGKSTLYNLMVSVEGDFEGQGLSYYVGNFEPGRTDFFDVQFTPMIPGQQKGAVLFAFEDANGKKTEVRKEFELNVMEMQMGPDFGDGGFPIDGGFDPGMDMPGGPAKTSIWVYIGIGAGVLIAAVVVFIILRKRHIKRKELSLDE